MAAPAQASSMAEGSRIPALDGWRGLAIFLVVFGHAGHYLIRSMSPQWRASIAQHGVGIFFTLSGYLITSLLIREMDRTGALNLRAFYTRRFFRLMPAAWTYLAVVAIILRATRKPLYTGEIIPCLFFFRNYVDLSGQRLITGHFWSLSIEEQFYLVWPTTLLLAGRRRAVWIALAGAAAVAAYRILHLPLLAGLPIQATLKTQYRADGLLIGCAAALLAPAISKYLRPMLALPLFALLMVLVAMTRPVVPLYESAVVAALLVLTSNASNPLAPILAFKPLAYLGRISYSVYLWNQLFLIFGPHMRHPAAFIAAFMPATVLASYYLIERPCIRFGSRLLKSRRPQLARASALPSAGPVELVP